MPKVLVADSFPPKVLHALRERGIEAITTSAFDADAIAKADALLIGQGTPFPENLLKNTGSLHVIGVMGTDTSNVDVAAATRAGIIVMNTPYGNIPSAAEHTLAMMLSLARQIPQANASLHAGKWQPENFPGMEIAGKTLGIIGCGKVGTMVAEKARALGLRVIVHDPYLSNERADELRLEKVTLDSLLSHSDIISLHPPLTEKTRAMINAETLARTKKGVRIVNCGRGELIIEADLAAAIKSGQVAGAALDAFTHEPLEASPFFGMENVILTPHLSIGARDSGEGIALQIAEQVGDFLLSGAITCAVNAPSLTAEEAAKVAPFRDLADQLGSFVAQIADQKIKAITIDYCGAVADMNVQPLTAIIVRHILGLRHEGVNLLTAAQAAREQGIHVMETHSALSTGHPSLIIISASGERERHSVSGTLFGGLLPRLVTADDVPIEARLTEHMLYIRSGDRPGLIGNLGNVLGEFSVNIGSFYLGRSQPGGEGRCIISVDAPLAPGIREKLASLPDIIQASILHFG